MIVLIIIPSILLIWWISGFARAINPKRNRWHAWGPFGQIWGFIDGDKKSLLPKSLPWPFNKVFFTLTYTQFVEDGNLIARNTEKSTDGKTIFYRAAQEIKGVKKPVRVVTEEVTRIRKTEIHPYVIKVTLPKIGGTFYLVFTVKIQMINPMKTLKLEEFLVFVGNQLSDVIYPWAVEWEKTAEARNLTLNPGLSKEELANLIIDEIIGLNIDSDDAIMLKIKGVAINLKNYMNSVVKEFGGKIPDFSLDVGYDEKIESLLNARNEQTAEVENKKKEEKISLTTDVTRARQKKNVLQDIELKEKELKDITIPFLEAQADANEKSNKAWGEGGLGTLMIGEQKSGLLVQPTPNTKKEGGANVTT